ncbi:MAG: NAD(P)H-dependent oxidoreductase [Pseudomonadota bacterium]
MKILHLVFHPDLKSSRVNRVWRDQIAESGKAALSRDVYAEYPDFQIDVDHEQSLLLDHDRIVLQFPMYWYATPPLLKKWLDDVLTYGFAYGSTGTKLQGKDLQLILSVGGQEKYYSGFGPFATVHELMRPFELTALLCKMKYALPVWMLQSDTASEDVIRNYGKRWVNMIDDPMRSDPIAFLAGMDDTEPDLVG